MAAQELADHHRFSSLQLHLQQFERPCACSDMHSIFFITDENASRFGLMCFRVESRLLYFHAQAVPERPGSWIG